MFKRFISLFLLLALLLSLLPVVHGAGVRITSDAEFFSKLDLNRSGLEKVKTATGKADYTTAKKELLNYYKKTFSGYEAKPFSGTSDNRVFMAMNDVVGFSEDYIDGVWVSSTTYEPYTLNLSSNINGIYVLDQIYATTDGVGITTSESSTPPQLSLYSSDGTLLKTITAIEDTAVRPGKDLSAGLGSSTVMYAKHWPDTKNNLPYSSSSTRCYIRFDTTQIPSNARTAKLTVYCKRSPGNADKVLVEDSLYLCVFQSYCTNWSEDTLTWDSLISGRSVGHYSYNGLSGGFDWKKPAGTPSEWLNYNTRFYEVRGLVLKGTETEDTTLRNSYMNKAKELVLDFINDAGVNTPANRALEPANRLIEFPFIYKHLVCGGYLTPDENVRILSWLYDDTTDQYNGAYTLFTGPNATPKSNLPYTNWGLWHLTGFYSSLSYFPEFKEASSWRSVYDARLGVVMDGIIMEDGSYNEVTFGYPGSVISWCATLKDIMDQFGDNSANAAMFSKKMLQLTKYLVDCSLPNGKPPFWGEGGPSATMNAVNTTLSGLNAAEMQQELAKYLRHYQDRGNGLPLETMAQYDGIRVVTDRTGWSSGDSMIFMNAKCAGSHSHRDALALLLYYEGRNLLADTGMTSYDGAHTHFPFQRSTTRSHNTIEVDGLAQTLGTMVTDGANRGDIDITGNSAVSTITSWSTANNKDMATLKVEGTKTTNTYHSTDFTHSRDVSFLKELGSILVVTDKVEPGDNKSHSYTQNWHSAPYANNRLLGDASLTGTTAYSTGSNLIIAQADATGISASLQTGYDATAPAAPTKYFEYKQTKAGIATYQTILYPVASGATATVQPKKLSMSNTTDAQALAMEVAISDSSKPQLSTLIHYHSFEDSPSQRSFGSYSSDAVTAMGTLNSQGKIFFASLSQGSGLTKNGIPVLCASEKIEDLSAVLEDGVLSMYSGDTRAQGLSYELNFSGQKITRVMLNGEPIAFTQQADGTVQVKARYVLLDFTKVSMAAQTGHWSGQRATAEVDSVKGILSGTITGGDPNVRMTSAGEYLGYEITAGDIIELRMKTTITEGSAKGVQVFFQDRNTPSYSEAYSCKNLSLDHATGRYATIQLPFSADASYVGQTIDRLRVDMLHLASGDSVGANYEIDYIYLGPAELAPSASAKAAEYLYFDFGNKTVDEQRYVQEAYGGYPFDLDCWGTNVNRNGPAVLNQGEGTLSFHIKEGNSHSYVQTSDFEKGLLAEPLYYFPKAEDMVQVRLRFDHCTPTTQNPRLMLYHIRDNMGDVTNDYSYGELDPEKILSGEYMVVEFPVTEVFANAECINALRFTIGDVADDGSGESRIIVDYFYVGPREYLPLQNKLFFDFDNGEEAQERYSKKTYGGYNYDTGCWGVNAARANPPVLDNKEGTLSFTIPQGSSGPYFQTTTGVNSLTTMPLTYFPGEADQVQLRVKFQNCTGASPYMCLYYIKDNSGTVTSNNSKISVDPALLNADAYTVLTFDVSGGFASAEVINSIRITASGIADDGSGKGKITFDYIYIGSEGELPTPRYRLTFLNGDGSPLQSLTVYKGENGVYTGELPTKASDAMNHYSFAGWDQDLTNVTADLTVLPKFTAEPHSYEYSATDESAHSRSCSCGYSEAEDHFWGEGVETTAPTCTEQGVTTFTCALCKATKTQPIDFKGHTEVIDKAVAATCTATGLTEGKHCSVCKVVLTAQDVVPATGHAPVYTPKDEVVHTITCENCDHVEEAAHSYLGGKCICGQEEAKEPVEETTWKMNHTLNLASDISVNLAISKSYLAGFDMDTVYVLAELDTYEGNAKTGVETLKILPVEQGNYYYFTLNGLTAVNMNDRIRSVLYGTKDGQPYYSPVDEYSIATYAYSQMGNAGRPQKLKNLCAELLRYGTRAQIFKSYRLDALADSKMTEEQKTFLSDMDSVVFGNTNVILDDLASAPIKWEGKALDLASKVTVKFVFSMGTYTGELADLTLRVSYEDIYGATKTLTIGNAELYNEAHGYYAFTLDALLAAELRSVLSVQIYEGETPVSCTLQYSADTYGNNKKGDLLELCKALFAYSDSAKIYFAE